MFSNISCPLSLAKPGQKYRILYICENRYKYRLIQMGFVDDTEIEVIRKAPLNDPIEFKIGDFHIGLRKEEAKEIIVEML